MICASLLTNPPSKPETLETRCETLLCDLNVRTIINVASDVRVTDRHREIYQRLHIRHVNIPIEDSEDEAPPASFLPSLIRAYEQHRDGAILINCAMGVNRSALAAGIILWGTSQPRPWQSPQEMIEYMRRAQREDRGVLLLTNSSFERALVQWAAPAQETRYTPSAIPPRPITT